MPTLLAPLPRSPTTPATEYPTIGSSGNTLRTAVLIVGRDRRERDDRLTRRLVEHFDSLGVEVLWDDPVWGAFERLEAWLPGSRSWPRSFRRRLRQFLSILWGIHDPIYLKELVSTQGLSLFAREVMLRRRIAKLQPGRSIFLLGRSAGGVMCTHVADEFDLPGVLCLGYPFRSPGKAVEPIRTAHLGAIKTRTVILQGEADVYGGRSIVAETAISPNVEIRFFPIGHEFDAPEPVWNEIYSAMHELMGLR